MLTFSINRDFTDIVTGEKAVKIKTPTNRYGREWLSVAIFSAFKNNKMEGTSLDTDAYGMGCEKIARKKKRKEVNILADEELEAGFGGGVTSDVVKSLDDSYEKVIESRNLDTVVTDFIEMQEYLKIEEGVNLFTILTRAIANFSRSQMRIKQLVEEYEMEEIIVSVLKEPSALERIKKELSA